MTIIAQKIRIYPNNKQKTALEGAFGTSRFAYNWAIQQCLDSKKTGERCPTGYDLSKQFNAIKKEKYPWVYLHSKWVVQKALYNAGDAFKRFFKKQSRFPRFKSKKSCRASFYVGLNHFRIQGKDLSIPKLGILRLSQELRFPGKLLSVTVSRVADKYFASVQIELDETYIYPYSCENQAAVGIDVGIHNFVVLSNGEVFQAPRVLRISLRKLKALQRKLSKKKKLSKNWKKAKLAVAKLHYRISCIRKDFIHKLTAYIVSFFRYIGIEDLNIRGMMKNHKLAQSILDVSFYEFKRQLMYKAKLSGSELMEVDRFFPSTKLCSCCGFKNDYLTLKDRSWTCPSCGILHDRDLNAATNILKEVAARHAETINACGETVRHMNHCDSMQDSEKQEGSCC